MTQQGKIQPGQQFSDTPQNMSGVERVVFGTLGAALLVFGVRQRSAFGAGLGLLGAVVAGGAALGKSPYNAAIKIRRTQQAGGIHVQKSVTIGRPVEEVYAFWRNFENLPRFMNHLKSVEQQGDGKSHWVANAPAGLKVEWDAQTTQDIPNGLIAWKAVENAQVPNEGKVEFRAAPGDRGTEVRVELQYFPPGGTLGAGIARLFGEEPSQQIQDDLMKLKRLMEVGYEPTTQGQPSGRPSSEKSAGAVESVTNKLLGGQRGGEEGVQSASGKPSNSESGATAVLNPAPGDLPSDVLGRPGNVTASADGPRLLSDSMPDRPSAPVGTSPTDSPGQSSSASGLTSGANPSATGGAGGDKTDKTRGGRNRS